MNNVIKALQDKDDKKAYALFKEIRARSAASDEYYSCFDDFLELNGPIKWIMICYVKLLLLI